MYASGKERFWALLAHWLSLVGPISPFACVPALVIYLMNKNQSRFVAFHALQTILFHLLFLLGIVVGGWVLGALGMITFGISNLLLLPFGLFSPIVYVALVLYIVYAGMRAWRGDLYQYVLAGPIARGTVGI